MSEANETHAAIAAEMRDFSERRIAEGRRTLMTAESVGLIVHQIASRFEAAHERELAASGDAAAYLENGLSAIMALTEPSAHALDLLGTVHRTAKAFLRQTPPIATAEKPSAVGNNAKLRKALSDACYAMFNFLKTQNGGYEEMANALDKAKVALAQPPRNCDVARDWIRDLYAHFKPPASVRREMPPEWVDSVMAFCRWLVAPATEKEGGEK